jgi:hypothetical protein
VVFLDVKAQRLSRRLLDIKLAMCRDVKNPPWVELLSRTVYVADDERTEAVACNSPIQPNAINSTPMTKRHHKGCVWLTAQETKHISLRIRSGLNAHNRLHL